MCDGNARAACANTFTPSIDMQTICLTLRPLTALGTPLAGDTLFGQLCWTLHHQLGNDRLNALLQGYTQGQPFAVVSDALPSGHVPLPSLPSAIWAKATDGTVDRKALKKKRWLPLSAMQRPLPLWQTQAVADADTCLGKTTERAQPHNTINRQTGTTGTGMFAPYTVNQLWLKSDSLLDVWLVFDAQRISAAELQTAFIHIGHSGYGRDASIGLGKFDLVGEPAAMTPAVPDAANAYLTLGPCAPQGLGFCPVRSHWQVTTRFGRHGDVAVQSGNPFKRPVLLAKAGSVFWPKHIDTARALIGQGLGGAAAPVSLSMPETVQQGYCPVLPIAMPAPWAASAGVEVEKIRA